ncbi:MAG: metallophosphatase family protein [Candidatus Omnitrophica bacterium]|nr:metallophosphatase family protein [Candidatus Omnitrophota bacterium]MBU4149927.1 metallophosphatase family protein [Candidatus Omnitrophota bacterium]
MKIGVISDTHIPVNCCDLPPELIDSLKGCDLIVHAGDLIDLCILEELKKVSKVEAVCGNMDLLKVQEVLKKKKTLEVAGKKICLMHGYGNPSMLISIMKEEFFSQKPDIIIFGHSHVPMNEYIDGVLFFNPGSATDTVFAPYRSYGIIEIENGEVKAEIYKL